MPSGSKRPRASKESVDSSGKGSSGKSSKKSRSATSGSNTSGSNGNKSKKVAPSKSTSSVAVSRGGMEWSQEEIDWNYDYGRKERGSELEGADLPTRGKNGVIKFSDNDKF